MYYAAKGLHLMTLNVSKKINVLCGQGITCFNWRSPKLSNTREGRRQTGDNRARICIKSFKGKPTTWRNIADLKSVVNGHGWHRSYKQMQRSHKFTKWIPKAGMQPTPTMPLSVKGELCWNLTQCSSQQCIGRNADGRCVYRRIIHYNCWWGNAPDPSQLVRKMQQSLNSGRIHYSSWREGVGAVRRWADDPLQREKPRYRGRNSIEK